MACKGCRRVVKALVWTGCMGGLLFSSCNALVRVPRGRVDVTDEQVFVKLPGVLVDVTDGHVLVDVLGIEVDVLGHIHHHQ